ncbi:MAG: glycoside hydrolase family 130 protein [Saprospiraceae bacterium]|nr:glycoside hydrolase family 130 protein [Saprospiraceae bacterium]
MGTRFEENPIILTSDIRPAIEGMKVECVLNPGVFTFQNKTWLLLRVAERPHQKEGAISFPIMDQEGNIEIKTFDLIDPELDLSDSRMVTHKGKMYLSTLSHLRLVCSDDGKKFYEPIDRPTKIFGHGEMETYGIEDCRVSYFNDQYYLTFTQVSENGVGVGMMRTKDWIHFERDGMILPPHNKDCALFEEKIQNIYYCLHRPSGIGLGGNFIWQASSPDLLHWGNHKCVMQTRPGMWDCARIGAGTSPVKTEYGWLEIYHGADFDNRYCLGAVLFDLKDPSIVLARSEEPIFEPTTEYETNGFFGNVVFTNGHLVKGDEIIMYYGASDEVICGATLSISEILNSLSIKAS